MKVSVAVPEPEAYDAVPELFKAIVGVPVIVTFSEKVTVTATISPVLYVPFSVDELTEDTVGAIPSITIFFCPPRELAPPTVGNVRVALFPAASLIVPLFSAREFVAE